MFLSRLGDLKKARAFLESFCEEAGIARQAGLRLNLVVEELFLNTVKHGHRGGADAPVWITLATEPEGIRLSYEDHAGPFNPFAPGARELLEALAETRREGGLGVLLANSLTTRSEYAYLFGRNRIRVTLAA
jgi:anti-sigma regulatory factor (Ser/Thr protein kinase)